jgi:hypothetical protein
MCVGSVLTVVEIKFTVPGIEKLWHRLDVTRKHLNVQMHLLEQFLFVQDDKQSSKFLHLC